MKILLSNPRGFCAGVRIAIEIVDQTLDALDEHEDLYVYHEIVHNRHVVERLRERGAIFVESIDEVPAGQPVVFSAHGVSPQVKSDARNRKLISIDATCPLVTKVHAEAIRYAKRGWQILLVGHKNHQEVIGTYGEAPDSIQIVESPDDIPNLEIVDEHKLVYLTQTTLSIDDAELIINALKEAFPHINAPPSDDICYATTNRQLAVRDQAEEVDLVLVIGSNNSSNSLRLTEIAHAVDTPSHLIDDVSMLNSEWLEGVQSVLITAGASAPERLVKELVMHLVEHYNGVAPEEIDFDEGMSFSMPASFKSFISSKLTVEGEEQ